MNLPKLIKQVQESDTRIMDGIAELPNYGGECHDSGHCKGVYHHLNHETTEMEIETYCLECGGRTDI